MQIPGIMCQSRKIRFCYGDKNSELFRAHNIQGLFFAHVACPLQVGWGSVPVISHQDPDGVMEDHTLAIKATP